MYASHPSPGDNPSDRRRAFSKNAGASKNGSVNSIIYTCTRPLDYYRIKIIINMIQTSLFILIFLRSFQSEFGRVCERRKLRMNVGKSQVMRYSRYGNGDRMHVIVNGEPIEAVDCFTSGRKWQPMEDVKGMWYTK